MDNVNIIDILKLGLPGLVFLLSLLSYHLLTKEQARDAPNDKMLSSIKQFMYVNIFLAILTIVAPIVDKYWETETSYKIFNIIAKADAGTLKKGDAAVCITVPYASRHLLIKDIKTGKAIQVFARSVIPCTSDSDRYILLTLEDAANLGWTNGENSSTVEVVPAVPGQMFVL